MLHQLEFTIRANNSPQNTGNLHFTKYERLRIEEGFDLLNLSSLTTLHLGRPAMEHFTKNLAEAKGVFDLSKHWSYLHHLPSRYGYVECLTLATDCVVARLKQMVLGRDNSEDEYVISLYVKALKSLQIALDDPEQSLHAETLCATELLSLFEVMK
jgi:hypothetical protein